MKKRIRIAGGQGFWGDLPDAPVRQVEGGPIDYLMLDYLAEVTMSIMQKQKARDASAGYARDFVPLMKQILPACVERDIKVIANAGGVNVEGCTNSNGPRTIGTAWPQGQSQVTLLNAERSVRAEIVNTIGRRSPTSPMSVFRSPKRQPTGHSLSRNTKELGAE